MYKTRSIHGFSVAALVRGRRVLFAALALSLVGISSSAAPGDVSKFPINDDNPSASIPPLEARNASPLQFGYFLQDLYTRGELAFEKHDWATAAKYFEAIVKVVPDRARSFSKLCESYQKVGNFDLAVANCAKAIVLPGATLIDHKRFIETTLARQALSVTDVANLDASIAHVREHIASLPVEEPPPHEPVKPLDPAVSPEERHRALEELKAAQSERKEALLSAQQRATFMLQFEGLACRLALRLRDVSRLNRCIDELKSQKADARALLTFEWTRALITRDRARSLELLEQAKSLAIPDATLQAMAREQEDTFGVLALLKRHELAAGVVVALVVIVSGVLAWARRRRRRSAAPRPSIAANEPAAS